MIDGSVAMVLVGAAIQALPPVRSLVAHIGCRSARSARPASMTREPARS